MAYPKLRHAEITGNVKLGAVLLIQYYSVFSARPSLGYGTLIHWAVRMQHFSSSSIQSFPSRLVQTPASNETADVVDISTLQ